jgi:hypothetical protein
VRGARSREEGKRLQADDWGSGYNGRGVEGEQNGLLQVINGGAEVI